MPGIGVSLGSGNRNRIIFRRATRSRIEHRVISEARGRVHTFEPQLSTWLRTGYAQLSGILMASWDADPEIHFTIGVSTVSLQEWTNDRVFIWRYMTVRTHYYPTTETFEELVRKLKAMTREVKFGPFNIMKRNFDRFPKPWVGEIDKRGEYFKLFRTKGQENTSDLSVHGKYVVRSGQPHIEVKHKLHYTSLTGFAGLGVFVFCVFFLMGKKGIVVHPALQVLTCLIVLVVYGYTFYRDLKADEKLIKVLINARWVDDEEVEEDDEGGGEEYEE